MDLPRLAQHDVPGSWSFKELDAQLGDVRVPIQYVDALGIVRKEEHRAFTQWRQVPSDFNGLQLVPTVRALDLAWCPTLARAVANNSTERHHYVRGLFCSLRGSTTALHADGRDNSLTVLHGAKAVFLISRDVARDLSMSQMSGLNEAICTRCGPELLTAVKSGSRAEELCIMKNQSVNGVLVECFIIRPGFTLQIPRFWLHAIVNVSDCVAVSAWERTKVVSHAANVSSGLRNAPEVRPLSQELPRSLWSIVVRWAFSADPRGVGAVAAVSKAVSAAVTHEHFWGAVLHHRWLWLPEEVSANDRELNESSNENATSRRNFISCRHSEEGVRALLALPPRCLGMLGDDSREPDADQDVFDPFDVFTSKQLGRLLFAQAQRSTPPMVEQISRTLAGDADKCVSKNIRRRLRENSNEILCGFMSNLDIKGLNLIDACRRLFKVLKLPGEALLIELIMQAFSVHFSQFGGASEEEEHMDPDTAFVLSFSVIMLNTDLHNPLVKKKMSERDFVAPQRGINNGFDMPDVLIRGYYQSIKAEPIFETCVRSVAQPPPPGGTSCTLH